jgi:outer membrane immunogenic protein
MRRVVAAAMILMASSLAQAADMPDFGALRGSIPANLSTTTRNWEGWYVGGQAGYESADMDFSRSVVSLTNFIFRNSVLQQPTSQWSLLTKNHTQGSSFGGFAGRNFQWEDAVFGFEVNYNYMSGLASSSSNSMALAITNPAGTVAPPGHTYTYNTSLTGSAAAQIKDVVTFRGRAGWAADDFMPYMFGGLAVGRIAVSRSVSSNVVLRDDQTVTTTDALGNTTTISLTPVFSPVPSLSTTSTDQRTNSFVAGWTAGLGLEYMVWGNLFMRGEWEYVKFLSVKDTSISMNSARAGLGYKF